MGREGVRKKKKKKRKEKKRKEKRKKEEKKRMIETQFASRRFDAPVSSFHFCTRLHTVDCREKVVLIDVTNCWDSVKEVEAYFGILLY